MAAAEATSISETNIVPQIIVTEPTPLNRSSSTMSIKYACALEDSPPAKKQNDAETIPSSASAVDVEEIVDQFGRDSSEDYTPARQFLSCVPSNSGSSSEVTVGVLDVEREIPETDNLRHASQINSTFEAVHGLCYRCSDYANSAYALIMWTVLLGVPISAGFMGARYLNDCNMSPSAPALLFIMGISGVLMLTSKMISIIYDIIWEEEPGHPCLITMVAITTVITFILFCTELMVFWRFSPSFDSISSQYCDPTFYNFTFWINCTTILLFLLPAVICVTRCIILRQYRV